MKVKKGFLAALITFFAAMLIVKAESSEADELIAYSRVTNGFWQIWVALPNGDGAYQLTNGEFDKRYPTWITGKSLIYRTNDGRLFEISLDTAEDRRILDKFDNIARFDVSGDGGKIVFTRYRTDLIDDCDIWVANSDGSSLRMITNDAGPQYDPSWSPDSKKVAFASHENHTMHAIWAMEVNEGKKVRLVYNDSYNIMPDFSPDGRRIAFASNRTGDYEIWLMDSGGENQRQITYSEGMDSSPSWSPDGSKIIFVSNRSGSLQLWKMDPDGLNREQITHGEDECQDPAWIRKE